MIICTMELSHRRDTHPSPSRWHGQLHIFVVLQNYKPNQELYIYIYIFVLVHPKSILTGTATHPTVFIYTTFILIVKNPTTALLGN